MKKWFVIWFKNVFDLILFDLADFEIASDIMLYCFIKQFNQYEYITL